MKHPSAKTINSINPILATAVVSIISVVIKTNLINMIDSELLTNLIIPVSLALALVLFRPNVVKNSFSKVITGLCVLSTAFSFIRLCTVNGAEESIWNVLCVALVVFLLIQAITDFRILASQFVSIFSYENKKRTTN